MDDEAKFKALTSEFEAETSYLLRRGAPSEIAYIRVFQDKGGLVRLVVDAEGEQLQICTGRQQLMVRLDDPQQFPDESD